MHVVIGGYGRTGRFLAHMLENQGHSVAVIDRNADVFEEFGQEIRGRKLIGEVFDRETMRKAGIEDADVYAAVTSGDNSNIVSARAARDRFGVPHVVARIYDPRRAVLYENFGIPTISSVQWASSLFLAMILQPDLRTAYAYGGGEVVLVDLKAGESLAGKKVSEVGRTCCVRVSTLVRDGVAQIPPGDLVIAKGDHLYVDVVRECLDELTEYLEPEG
jgi:trk system potassium uptake protein TrkA